MSRQAGTPPESPPQGSPPPHLPPEAPSSEPSRRHGPAATGVGAGPISPVALAPAVGAAVALVLWGSFSSLLPALPVRLDIMLSSALVLALLAVLVWGLLPLGRLGRRLPLLAVVALPFAIVCVWLGWVPLANVAKVVAAAALGIWIASELERLSWVVIIAVVSAAVDVVSVAAGPTRAIIGQGPVVVGYFTVAVTWAGYSYSEAFTGLGISDVIFFALYLGTATRFGLRTGWSAVAMTLSLLATIALAMWWTALPALPLLSAAFLLMNADLLVTKLRRPPAGPA